MGGGSYFRPFPYIRTFKILSPIVPALRYMRRLRIKSCNSEILVFKPPHATWGKCPRKPIKASPHTTSRIAIARMMLFVSKSCGRNIVSVFPPSPRFPRDPISYFRKRKLKFGDPLSNANRISYSDGRNATFHRNPKFQKFYPRAEDHLDRLRQWSL